MIHRDVEVIDLDPSTWRNIGQIVDVTELGVRRLDAPHVLSILHANGVVLRVDAPKNVSVPPLTQVDDPRVLAQTLYTEIPGLERVQVLEKERLAAYSTAVQQLPWETLSLDEFYLCAQAMVDDDPVGLCVYPPRPRHWNYFDADIVRSWLLDIPDGATVVLGVYEDARPWFTLITRIVGGEVRLITTFEVLKRYGLSETTSLAETSVHVCTLTTEHLGPVAHALFCERAIFEQWVRAPDKTRVLNEAAQAGKAITHQAARMPQMIHPFVVASRSAPVRDEA
jgi:hypothetical protein